MKFLDLFSKNNIILFLIVLFPLDQLFSSIFPDILINPFRLLFVLMSLFVFRYNLDVFGPIKSTIQLFFAYVILAFISLLWSADIIKNFIYSGQLLMSVMFSIVAVSELFKDNRLYYKLTFWSCFVGGIIAQLSLLGLFSSRELNIEQRIEFDGIGVNAIAISLGYSFILGVTCLFDKSIKKLNKILIILSCLSIFYFLIRTGTRSSIFGVILALGLGYLFSFKINMKNLILFCILSIVILWSFNFFMENYIGERLVNRILKIDVNDIESNERIILWQMAFDYYSENILGTGSGNEELAFSHSISKEAHNVFVSSLLQLGPLGIGIIIFVMIKVFVSLFRIKNIAYKFTTSSIFIFLMFQMMKGSFFQNRIFWIPLIIIMTFTLKDYYNYKSYRS